MGKMCRKVAKPTNYICEWTLVVASGTIPWRLVTIVFAHTPPQPVRIRGMGITILLMIYICLFGRTGLLCEKFLFRRKFFQEVDVTWCVRNAWLPLLLWEVLLFPLDLPDSLTTNLLLFPFRIPSQVTTLKVAYCLQMKLTDLLSSNEIESLLIKMGNRVVHRIQN